MLRLHASTGKRIALADGESDSTTDGDGLEESDNLVVGEAENIDAVRRDENVTHSQGTLLCCRSAWYHVLHLHKMMNQAAMPPNISSSSSLIPLTFRLTHIMRFLVRTTVRLKSSPFTCLVSGFNPPDDYLMVEA